MGFALLKRIRSKNRDSGVRPPTSLPPGAGLISCEVADPVGLPLGNAEITVLSARTGEQVMKAMTDPYGLFSAALPPDRYTVRMVVNSLLPAHHTVDVVAGEHVSIGRVQLQPSPHVQLPAPGTWLFDPPHTAIRFIARHVGMANVHGRFERFDGVINVADRMEDSRVEVTIDAASINTGNNTRDNHLRSADFLDVANYPYIHFASTRFAHRTGAQWTIHGSLTMHGITRSVSLDTDYLGAINGGYGTELRCAALARTELHREDYTLNWRSMLARGIAVVGPTVKLELDVQAMFQSPDTPTPPQ
ncbi:YceI family protein [Streptomyces glaucosporus]|uniref:YceI family protein n=1 Tax=Streptomyces glaucosporus TaxID=284044 RepID=A0ABN3INB9_9ACTN